MSLKTRILVLGGGFSGAYAALELERALGRDRDVEITLVNRENFFLFTPMLHEVAAGDLDPSHVVNPLRKLLRRAQLFHGEVLAIDLPNKTVSVTHGVDRSHPHELQYDHLVLGLGSVTNFHGLPGSGRCLTMKSLGDAFALRNRVVENLEEADFECCAITRQRMMSFVVAGGGFAGVETMAAIRDFALEILPFYRNLKPEQLRTVLVHSGERVLPELGAKLGAYTQEKLGERGVEVKLGTRVSRFADDGVTLSDGTTIPTRTLIWTAGTSPHPLLAKLPCETDRGRVVVDECLRVPGWPGVWSLGDCARVPDVLSGGNCPPTAQHASRQGRILARNIEATIRGRAPKPFKFRTLGQLASLGRRTGVANILGWNFSGFVAWWLWRTIYLAKLPRFERKFRVALEWTLDLIFSKDLVCLPTRFGPEGDGRKVPAPAPALALATSS